MVIIKAAGFYGRWVGLAPGWGWGWGGEANMTLRRNRLFPGLFLIVPTY